MSNIYHLLYHHPALEREEMEVGIEEIAVRLVESGLMRIDAFDRINFARFYRPYEGVNLIFTYRQIYDPKLLPRTKQMMSAVLARKTSTSRLAEKVETELVRLKDELSRYQFTEYDLEIKLARLILQCNHPVVIILMILENVELYISYSHNIGDVLDVVTYQQAGQNGGMQSTDGRNAAVFISCGGNPFTEPETKDLDYGDGFPAMARLLVIGGQETGHYADIMRDQNGRYITRHSANLYGTRPKTKMKKARIADISHTRNLEITLNNIGLSRLCAIENHVMINRKYKRYDLTSLTYYLKQCFFSFIFKKKCLAKKIKFFKTLPKTKYLGSQISEFIYDQKFNASPKAPVYQNDDPLIEETIACIEALARVPQQVNKWGHYAVRTFWPQMYKIYYNDVITTCITSYEHLTGKRFHINTKPSKRSIKYILNNFFKTKRKMFKHY